MINTTTNTNQDTTNQTNSNVNPETVKLSDYIRNNNNQASDLHTTNSVNPITTPNVALNSTHNTSSMNDSASSPAGSDTTKPPKKGLNLKMAFGALVLLVIIVGAVAGYFLTLTPQDVRQQAAGIGDTITVEIGDQIACNEACIEANADLPVGQPPDDCTKTDIYVVRYVCNEVKPGGCQDPPAATLCPGSCTNQTFGFDQSRQCGTQQIDLGCATPNRTYGNYIRFISYLGANSCTASSPPPSQPPPTAGSCGAPCTNVSQCNIPGATNPSCVNGICWDATACGSSTPPPTHTPPPTATPTPTPPELSCNSICTTNEQCTAVNSSYSCQPTYSSSSAFQNVTGNINAGTNTITGFSSVINSNGDTIQYLARDGQLWQRNNLSSDFQNVTNNIGAGSGDITSFTTSYDNNGSTIQIMVRGGQIWQRNNLSSTFQNVTNSINAGSGTITQFMTYYGENGRITQYLVRGGQIWQRNSLSVSFQDVSNNIGVGTGTITSFHNFTTQNNNLGQYLVRGGQVWFKENALQDYRCRLTSNPNSLSCDTSTPPPITPPPTTPPPTTPPPTGPMCKNIAILDQNNNEIDPNANPSPFSIGMIIKLSCAANDPSSVIDHYEFKIVEPDGTVVDGSEINPFAGASISLPYTINDSGQFKAQCRVCTGPDSADCQPYTTIN